MQTISRSRNRTMNLPKILMTNDYKKFKSNNETMVVSNKNYLGISKVQRSTNTLRDFFPK